MYKVRSGLFLVLAAAIALAGCSGGSNQVAPPPPGSAAVSFTVTDTPPMGAGILSFEATLTGATLNPGNVDLLGGTTPRIEVKQLETESAFLNTKSVTAGTYTSVNLTFSMPEVTFVNNTGAVLAGCAVSAVCENKPMGTLTSTFTFPGSGITISANSPTGLRVDISPDVILTPAMGVDFSAAGATTVTQLTALPAGELDDLDDIRGTVQNLDTTNKKFDLVTFAGTFSITTNANTQFEFEGCAANDFTCLANGKVVEVDAMVQPGGTFVAKKIEFEDDVADDEIEGVVFKVDGPTQFELAVLEELRNVANVDLGNPVQVTLDPSVQFKVKDEGLTVPSALKNSFESAVDTAQLIPGQAVEIRLKGPAIAATSTTPVLATTDRVRLRMSRFTAKIKPMSIASPNFSVDNLPPVFTPATTVHVQTQAATKFEGKASSFTDLMDGDTVSLKGLLFNSGVAATPELIAKKVRKR